MQKLTAIIFGATGLTGSLLLNLLIESKSYAKIKVFTRKKPSIESEKCEIVITDYDDIEKFGNRISGDHLFCCLGTTIKKAGSKENFTKIDHLYVQKIASIAKSNGVSHFLMVSSIGADANSRNFYLKTKGSAEKSVIETGFDNVTILRPSLLLGKREEFRLGEAASKLVIKPLSSLLPGKLKKYRPVYAESVAKAMINLALTKKGIRVIESDQI